jgi:hypothetical protein
LIALPDRDNVPVAVSPETSVVEAVHVEVVVAGDALAIRDIVEIQQPAFTRFVLDVARIMQDSQPDDHRIRIP